MPSEEIRPITSPKIHPVRADYFREKLDLDASGCCKLHHQGCQYIKCFVQDLRQRLENSTKRANNIYVTRISVVRG